MSVADTKARITAVPVDRLAAATAEQHDVVRGWWACVGRDGDIVVERDCAPGGIDGGIRRAEALADEGVAGVVLHPGTPVTDAVRSLVGLMCGVDASRITPPHPDDLQWMRHCETLRYQQSEFRGSLSEALELVDTAAASGVGLLLGLAARRTPVVLAGPFAHAVAVVAQRQAMAAGGWWRSGATDVDPLVAVANARLGYTSWWSTDIRVPDDVVSELLVGTMTSLRA